MKRLFFLTPARPPKAEKSVPIIFLTPAFPVLPMPERVEQSDDALLRPLKYEREAATTAQLTELETLTKAAIARRLPELKAETLVALIRGWDGRGDTQSVETATDALMGKVDGWLTRRLKRFFVNPTEREDARGEIILDALTGILSRADGDAFWECRFFVCLRRALWDVVGRTAKPTQSFVQADDTDTTDWTPDTSPMTPEVSAVKNDALTRLPPKEREVFVRTHLGGETQQEIAKTLGVTDRTIRNLLTRAETMLADWRAESEDMP